MDFSYDRLDDIVNSSLELWNRESNVKFLLLAVRALRAKRRGDEADSLLCRLGNRNFYGSLNELCELAEELIQSLFFSQADLVINAIRDKLPWAYHFLRGRFFVEIGDLTKAEEELSRLKEFSVESEKLSNVLEILILLKKRNLSKVEVLLGNLSHDNSPQVKKLQARFEIAAGRLMSAKERLEGLASLVPNDWEWRYLMAVIDLGLGKLDSAIELLSDVLKIHPRNAEALAVMSRVLLSKGERQRSRVLADRALSLKPNLDLAVRHFIEELVVRREFSKAIELLERLEKICDTPGRAAMRLDIMRLQGVKVKKLLDESLRVLERYPDDVDVLKSVSAALIACKRKDRAEVVLRRLININPYDIGALINLGALYRERSEIDEAVRIWRRLAESGNTAARLNIVRVMLDRGDYEGALREIEELSRLPEVGNCSELKRLKIDLLISLGELESALEEVESLCRREPRNAYNWLGKARVLKALKGVSEALKVLESVEERVDNPLVVRSAWFDMAFGAIPFRRVVEVVNRWIGESPSEPNYWKLLGQAYAKSGDYEKAEMVIDKLIELDPEIGIPNRLRLMQARGRFDDALIVAQRWLEDNRADVKRYGYVAELLYLLERFEEAINLLREALRVDYNRFSIVNQLSRILSSLERYDEAIDVLRDFYFRTKDREALHLWFDTLIRSRRFDEAAALINSELEQVGEDLNLSLLLVRALEKGGKVEKAISLLQEAFQKRPENEKVARELVRLLLRNDRTGEAKEVLEKFISRTPKRKDLLLTMAELLIDEGALKEAREILYTLIESDSERLLAWLLLAKVERLTGDAEREKGVWLQLADRFPAHRWVPMAVKEWARLGLESEFQRVLERWQKQEPDSLEPLYAALSFALSMKSYATALRLVDMLEERDVERARLLSVKGQIYNEMEQMDKAIEYAERAHSLDRTSPAYLVELINYRLKAGDWDRFDDEFARLERLLGDRRYSFYRNLFFNINCHPYYDAEKVYRYHREWYAKAVLPGLPKRRAFQNSKDPNKRLKVGYLSPDFRQHVVAKFSEALLMAHNREDFELYGYANFESARPDNWTERFKGYFDHWRDITNLGVDALYRLIKKDGIDILIDLAGHTAGNRLDVFALKPAPLLATHVMGSGQTTGMDVIDYIIATEDLIPEGFESYFAEKVERIPHKGLPYVPPDDVLPSSQLPCMNRGYVTFGVFARPVRTNRRTIQAWVSILKRVPKSKLCFEHYAYVSKDIQNRFLRIFREQGIDPDRIEFRNTRPYWAAFRGIDIQLDVFPAGSGTTATEGLYMERLVVTLLDRPVMGRVAACQLIALGLEKECVAVSEEEYIEKAVILATDVEKLKKMSEGLRDRFRSSSITDYEGYARLHCEAYRRWWIKWCTSV